MAGAVGCDMSHSSQTLEAIFRETFFDEYDTLLEGGRDEPVYLPARSDRVGEVNRLCYRRDYFASALHETAHWCIAGDERRKRVDFGYWYVPDGRTTAQQRDFLSAEVRPQALEWIFSVAAGYQFRLSLDNLCGELDTEAETEVLAFARAVSAQVREWCRKALPVRAGLFADALTRHYGVADPFDPANYRG